MTAATVPNASEIHDLMSSLFGLDVTSADAADQDIHVIAEYVDDAGTPVAWIGCDLAGACRMGAALTQVPAGRVDEAVADGRIPDTLAENLDEIFNISVNLVARPDSHTVFHRSVKRGQDADFDAVLEAFGNAERTEAGFEIARYGTCRFVPAT